MRHLLPRESRVAEPAQPAWAGGGAHEALLEDERGGWWGLVRRQRWIIAGSVAVSLALVGAHTWLATPIYEAESSIRIEEKASTVATLAGLMSSEGQLTTEMEVLRSRSLAESVVRGLDLQVQILSARRTGGWLARLRGAPIDREAIFARIESPPDADTGTYVLEQEAPGRFTVRHASNATAAFPVRPGESFRVGRTSIMLAASATGVNELTFAILPLDRGADALRARLQVTRAGNDANIVRVSFRDPDARLARDVVNTLTGNFIAARQQVQKTEARSASEYLRAQLEDVRAELAASEHALQSFREREQVVSLPDEASTQVTRLAQLQAERNALDAEREALATLLADVEREAARAAPGSESPFRRLLAFPSLLRNPAAAQLLSTLSAVENERADLLVRRTPRDEDVQQLTGRIEELEQQIRSIAATYARGLRDQIASLDATLGRYRAELAEIPAKEAELARLQRDPKVLEEMHALLQARLKEAEIAQAVEDPSVRVLDAAVVPDTPASPRPLLNLAAALVLGLGAGAAGAALREARDHAVHSRREVMVLTGLPVLGVVPAARGALHLRGPTQNGTRVRQLTAAAPRWPRASWREHTEHAGNGVTVGVHHGALASAELAEAYHRLVTNIAFTRPGEERHVLAVTSALPGDGKTTTALNLAITLSRRGQHVLLVDADLRRGGLHRLLGVPRNPGLADVVRGVKLDIALRPIAMGDTRLDFLPTGAFDSHAAEVVGAPALPQVIAALRERYDAVVLDAPPLNVVADPALLGAIVDGVVLVVRAGVTPREALELAVEQLQHARAPALGVVLNDVDLRRDITYDGAYQYYGSTYPARERGD